MSGYPRSTWVVFPLSNNHFLRSGTTDTTPLSEIEIIKLTRVDGDTKEQVIEVWKAEGDDRQPASRGLTLSSIRATQTPGTQE